MGFDTRIDTFMGEICAILKIRCQDQDQKDPGRTLLCPLGVFHAPAFAADFPPVAPEFYQRTHRVRLKNLGTTDKKSSRKIRYRKIPREHYRRKSICIVKKQRSGW